MYTKIETERGDECTEKETEKERRRNQKVSRNDFADPKPWQNGKQRRHKVGTGERGEEIEKEAMKKRRKKQKKREAILGHGERRECLSVSDRTLLYFSH